MANRVTGMSGMDTEGMVQKMMMVEINKVNSLYKQKTKLTWKQEAYRDLSSQLTTFQNKFFSFSNQASNLKSATFFAMKNFSIQVGGVDSKALSIKNTAMTKNVSHSLEIKQLATKQKYTSAPAADGYAKKIQGGEIDVNTLKEGMSVELNLDGKVVKATVDQDLMDKFAQIDTDGGSDKEKLEALAESFNKQFAAFGKAALSDDNKVNVAVNKDGTGINFETQAGRSLSVKSFSNGYTSSVTGAYDQANTADELKFKINGTDISVLTYDNVTTKDENGEDKTDKVYLTAEKLAERINEQLNVKGFNGNKVERTGADGNPEFYYDNPSLTVSASGNNIKFIAQSQTEQYEITEETVVTGDKKGLTDGTTYNLYGKTASELGIATGASTDTASSRPASDEFGFTDTTDLSQYTITGNGKTLSFEDMGITKDMSAQQVMNKINESDLGVTMSYNKTTGAYTMEAKQTGQANGFSLSSEAMGAFEFSGDFSEGSGNVEAKDAIFTVDGVLTSRESNDFELDGLNITLNHAKEGEVIDIKSSSDTDSMIKNIKDFVDNYNKTLLTLSGKYSEMRAKSSGYGYYEPLSDDEKAAMKEADIKLWEDKAKQGILSRDPSVGKVVDQLRNAMSQPVDLGDGRKITLSEIGIASTDWKDMGALTVDEDKLRKALEERPEDVAALFNKSPSEGYYGDRRARDKQGGLAYRLDDIIEDATKSTPHPKYKTYGYFVELAGSDTAKAAENQMSKALKELNQKIWDKEQYNIDKETSYYRMFAQMEKAMTQAQNQQSQLGF